MGNQKINLNTLLDQLPIVSDPEKLLIFDFFERTVVSAYNVDFNLVATLSLLQVRYSLQNGYCALAAISFMAYAMMLIIGFQDYKTASELGKLCVQIVDKFEDLRARTQIYLGVSFDYFSLDNAL